MAQLKTFLPPLLLMALIYLASSLPGDADDGTFNFMLMLKPTLQNALHIPLFGLLQYLWLRALAKVGKTGYRAIFTALVITISYGLVDEYHQTFVAGRYASLNDICLNLLGVILGTGLFILAGRLAVSRKRTT